ncbi:sugar ABC transporter permease [Actinoplanes sp. NPDC089786]|uniref:carbohydrate ABC transporter permease n=1 Tax=Actinoplanes sp. NPDC089786 TaxID=3155185 RepID=UPI003436B53D
MSKGRWPYLYILPMVAAILFAFGYPLVSVLRNSLYTGSIYELTYVGLGNFRALFGDDVFRTALGNNLKLLLTVPVMTVVALLLAVLIHEGVRGGRFYRAAIFFPYILPAVGTGLAFSVFLSLNGGLNGGLRALHLNGLALDWLGSPDLAIWSVSGMVVWQQLGFGVVVFLAALLSLPAETVEAARLDGASWWQLQTRVSLPQIRPTIEFFVVTEAITVLSWVFTYVYVLTGGGPGNASMVLEFYIWKEGFAQGAVGLANAAAVVVLALAAVLIAAYLVLRRRSLSSEGQS